MTTRVTVTGTGTPLATGDRAGPGVLVEYWTGTSGPGDDAIRLQFDAGRATVTRLAAAGVAPQQLTALFLTHYHSDHLVGLQDLVLSHWIMDIRGEAAVLPILAPNGHTIDFCERMLDIWEEDLAVRALHNKREPQPRIEIIGFDPPDEPTEVWSGDGAGNGVRVITGQVRHEPIIGAVGYRIETPDGVVAISGDTLVCDELKPLYRGAEVIVQEAMRMDVINQRPPHLRYITHYHSDTRLIGRLAAELDLPRVMLTHLIPAPFTIEEKQAFADEVREGGFTGELMVCDDLDTVTLG